MVLDALGIPPWRKTLGHEPAKALAILSHQPVKQVDERRQSERAKGAAERSGELDLGKEHDAPTPVARDWRAIAEYEPPTFAAPILRHRGEQAPGLLIGERKQCQFLASVERGDDPRRPTAEPSAAGIEQNRAWQVRGGRYARAHVSPPLRKRNHGTRGGRGPTRAPRSAPAALPPTRMTSQTELPAEYRVGRIIAAGPRAAGRGSASSSRQGTSSGPPHPTRWWG